MVQGFSISTDVILASLDLLIGNTVYSSAYIDETLSALLC
jgi:hypothetical protein